MTKKIVLLLCSVAMLCGSGNAASAVEGFDTGTGVTEFPFSIAGQRAMTLTHSGVGVGTASPRAGFDTTSSIKMGYNSLTCSGLLAGSIRYNGTTKVFEGCDGTSWRALAFEPDASAQITILSGTYGQNCGVAVGNATASVSGQCTGKTTCSYPVSVGTLGDPAWGCMKTFVVSYTCGAGTLSASLPGEANGNTLTFGCASGTTTPAVVPAPVVQPSSVISIAQASYGTNCRVAPGYATGAVQNACNGRTSCSYGVNHLVIGDPSFGCAKTFDVSYTCGSVSKSAHLEPEASGQTVSLSCQ